MSPSAAPAATRGASDDDARLALAGRITSPFDRVRPAGLAAVRVALGVLLVAHGLDKFDTGLANVAGAFDGWGVPLPELSSRFVAFFEVIGGLALIAGLATRAAALVMSLVLVGAIFYVKADAGLLGGWETDLAYLSGLVALIVVGPGRFSADALLRLERVDRTT